MVVHVSNHLVVDSEGPSVAHEGILEHLHSLLVLALTVKSVSNFPQALCHILVIFAIDMTLDLEGLPVQLERLVVLSLLSKDVPNVAECGSHIRVLFPVQAAEDPEGLLEACPRLRKPA